MPRERVSWWMYVVAASFVVYFGMLVFNSLWGCEPVGAIFRSTSGGVIVQDVSPRSPADRAGLQSGDRVISADGQLIHTSLDFRVILDEADAGRPVPLEIQRGGERREIAVDLERLSWAYSRSTNALVPSELR